MIVPGSMAWWFTPVIPALGRLRQEDHEFEANLGSIARSHLKKKERKTRKKYAGW
jgi:hypothetical protein